MRQCIAPPRYAFGWLFSNLKRERLLPFWLRVRSSRFSRASLFSALSIVAAFALFMRASRRGGHDTTHRELVIIRPIRTRPSLGVPQDSKHPL